jgi:hypothetical protein
VSSKLDGGRDALFREAVAGCSSSGSKLRVLSVQTPIPEWALLARFCPCFSLYWMPRRALAFRLLRGGRAVAFGARVAVPAVQRRQGAGATLGCQEAAAAVVNLAGVGSESWLAGRSRQPRADPEAAVLE